MTEKEKFEKNFNEEIKKGLTGFHVSISPDIKIKHVTVEDANEVIYKELNSLNSAIKENRVTTYEDY